VLRKDLKWEYNPSKDWMRLRRVGEIPAAKWQSGMDPTKKNYMGFIRP